MVSVLAPLRKEHPSLLLGERRPWDAAVPHWSAGPVESAGCHTNLPLVPGQPGVKCRVELVARGGPGARGNPGLCQPGRHPSASPGELAGTAGLPSPKHPPAATPCLSLQLCCTEGAGGLARHGGVHPGTPLLRELVVSFCVPKPWEGHCPQPPGPSGSQPACTGASQHKTSRLAACRLGGWPGGCRAAGRCLCPLRRAGPAADARRLTLGKEGSVPPRASPAARRSWGAVCRPGAGATGSLPSAVSWSHEPLPAALQEAAGPGDPLLLPVCHRDPLPR